MDRGTVQVVIPIKPLAASKRRLMGTLDEARRSLLSLWMLERVARAAAECPAVGQVAVVGGDAAIVALCHELGLSWEPDLAEGLNPALDACRRASVQRGWRAMLFLPADLPRLRAEEVVGLVDSSNGERLVLAPAIRGGTNGILIPGGVEFSFQLGPGSFRRHCQQATRLVEGWRIFESPGLEADIDEPEDLAGLEQSEPEIWRLVTEMDRFLVAPGVSGAGGV